MSSTTSHPPTLPPEPLPDSPRAVPSLDRLVELTSVPEERVVFRDVDWAFYERLVESIPPGVGIHVDYDGKDLEIMSPGPLHDGDKKPFGQFVEAVAQELEIPYQGYGQTTWSRPDLNRGLEADECYIFGPAKLDAATTARARRSGDVADYPNPDLAVEVEMTPPKTDRPGIYAALCVAEVWRFDGTSDQGIIERLGEDGSYHTVEASLFLPIRAEEIRRSVIDEDSSDQSAWARRLRAWVRDDLAPRLPR